MCDLLLLELKRAYAQQVPVRTLRDRINHVLGRNRNEALASLAEWDNQDRLAALTFANELRSMYPESLSYRHSFLKYTLDLIEQFADDNGISDRLLGALTESLTSPRETTAWSVYFTSAELSFDNALVLREDSKLIGGGTTGLRTWTAGLKLVEWLLTEGRSFLHSKSVVELGCGLGLVGLVASLPDIHASKVTLTDYHPAVLKRLEQNAEANIRRKVLDASTIKIETLDWTSPVLSQDVSDLGPSDVILASDVTYDPDLLSALCHTIRLFFDLKNSTCFVSLTIRNTNTYELFQKALDNHGLYHEAVDMSKSRKLFYTEEDETSVRILRVFLKS